MKILFVHSFPPGNPSTFVQQDLVLLRESYQMEETSLLQYGTMTAVLSSRTAWRQIAVSDVVVGWFGTVAAPFVLMASVLRKPTVIIAGGADVADIASIRYGFNALPWRARWLTWLGYRLASRILLFSEASRKSLLELPGMRAERAEVLYLGVDTDHFRPAGAKIPSAFSVGYVSESNLQRKGLLTFAQAAQFTPHIPYRLAGKPIETSAVRKIAAITSSNFSYLGYLDDAQLLTEYQTAKVYVQLSMHEGFGLALAEAMACECIPVVTRQGSLPEVAGDAGIYVPAQDPIAAGDAIAQALRCDAEAGRRARQHIIDRFPIDRRRAGLRAVIEAVTQR